MELLQACMTNAPLELTRMYNRSAIGTLNIQFSQRRHLLCNNSTDPTDDH